MEIELETKDGHGISSISVTELKDGLFRIEEGGCFLSDIVDFGDVVRLEVRENDKYLLVERVEPSVYTRTDWFLARDVDVRHPELIDYLEQIDYWELNYGGWLTVYVAPGPELEPDKELTAILNSLSKATANTEE